jgi:hypothetical protein
VAINSGFTIVEEIPLVGGQHFGLRMAYLIQATAAAVNPTWSWTSGAATVSASIASFKVGAGGVAVAVPLRAVSIVGASASLNTTINMPDEP